MAVKINGELSKKKMLDENSISAKDYYQKYLSEVKIDCIIARPSFFRYFLDTFSKRLSLQKDIIEAKMTSVAAKEIKAAAEERVKKTAKLSEAVLNKGCLYQIINQYRPVQSVLVVRFDDNLSRSESNKKKLGISENEIELAKNGHSDRGARLLSKSLNLDSRKR